jgi:hypothetical protein
MLFSTVKSLVRDHPWFPNIHLWEVVAYETFNRSQVLDWEQIRPAVGYHPDGRRREVVACKRWSLVRAWWSLTRGSRCLLLLVLFHYQHSYTLGCGKPCT